MIRDRLIPALERAFPTNRFQRGEPPDPVAIFGAGHPEVGEAIIFDDGHEARVVVGRITHGHFRSHDENLSLHEVERHVAKDVIDFLRALFDDQVLLVSSADQHYNAWHRLDIGDRVRARRPDRRYFLWSGPIQE